MQVLAWPIFAFLLLAVAVALWSSGGTRSRDIVARSRTWLACSLVGTLAALALSIFLVGLAALSDALGGSDPGRGFAIGSSPLLIALLVVAVTARGRAGPMPGTRRLLTLLLVAAFATALIGVSYLVLST